MKVSTMSLNLDTVVRQHEEVALTSAATYQDTFKKKDYGTLNVLVGQDDVDDYIDTLEGEIFSEDESISKAAKNKLSNVYQLISRHMNCLKETK